MLRLAIIFTTATLALGATPVLSQTSSDYNSKDTVATHEQGHTAAAGQVGSSNYNGWNNSPPIIGPVFGMVSAPFAMATAYNWGQPNAACGLYHDFNGRYTSVCGL